METEFYQRSDSLGGLTGFCKVCTDNKNAAWRKANPTWLKASQVAWHKANPKKRSVYSRAERYRAYGLTLADYAAMVAAQSGLCAVCGKNEGDETLCVDHDHSTGKVRGLLCRLCNIGLGGFKDSCASLIAAAEYIKKWKETL